MDNQLSKLEQHVLSQKNTAGSFLPKDFQNLACFTSINYQTYYGFFHFLFLCWSLYNILRFLSNSFWLSNSQVHAKASVS